MNTRAASDVLVGWRKPCAAGIVAATLLWSCAPESNTDKVHIQADAPAAHPRASDLYVHIGTGFVTVRAHDVSLHAVIQELAERAGLLVLTKDRLDQRVTMELESLTLTAALQHLLHDFSFILVDANQSIGGHRDGRSTLWIFAKELNPDAADVSVGSHQHVRRKEQQSLEDLSAALTDDESNKRLDAVSELGDSVDDAEAAAVLAAVASGDGQSSVRAEALHALARAGADTHTAVFTRALTDRDASVRKAAISALEDIGAVNSLQTLAIALNDSDASVRATAVDAIAEIGGNDALRLLESALADESAVVREAAERVLQTSSQGMEQGR